MRQIRSGASQPDQVDRDDLYVQHSPDSLSILGLWAGNQGDQRKCIVNHAMKHIDDATNYQVKPEDREVGMDTSTGAATATLPDPEDIEDGHEVTIRDEGGNAGTNNITVETPGSETVAGSATDSLATNSDRATYRWDAENSDWLVHLKG